MSYEDLVADIARALGEERRLSLNTVRAFIEGGTTPYETTVYTVAEYLKAQGVAA